MSAVARELEIIESVLVTVEQMSAKGEDQRRKRPPSELLVNLLQVVQMWQSPAVQMRSPTSSAQ